MRPGYALEHASDATGDSVRFDGDAVMSEIEGPAVGVVGYEDDATGGGEGERFWGERGEEGLESFEEEGEVRWGCG